MTMSNLKSIWELMDRTNYNFVKINILSKAGPTTAWIHHMFHNHTESNKNAKLNKKVFG